MISGSIPANAGEPSTKAMPVSVARVYPRERGGTHMPRRSLTFAPGLSPRTRGNHDHKDEVGAQGGSIPANAGEPVGRDGPQVLKGVYPRERGGTILAR